MDTATLPLPERCRLQHRFFSAVGEIQFRRSPVDGVAVLGLSLGERQASIPLRALQRELAIADDTADGQMFGLIGESLAFVSFLQPGDRLPSEVRTGEASWQPDIEHRRIVAARLRLRLVNWQSPQGRWARYPTDDSSLSNLSEDESLRFDVGAVALQVAQVLRLHGASTVIRRLDEATHELAHIQALRHRLLLRVEAVVLRVAQWAGPHHDSAANMDTVIRVHRLARIAYKQLRARFDDVEAQTDEIAVLLATISAQRTFIRANRDWLYRSQRTWDPLLTAWQDRLEGVGTDAALLARTYQFLAQRFMPTKEWQVHRQTRARDADHQPTAW